VSILLSFSSLSSLSSISSLLPLLPLLPLLSLLSLLPLLPLLSLLPLPPSSYPPTLPSPLPPNLTSHKGLEKHAGDYLSIPCTDIFSRCTKSIEVIGPVLEEEAEALHEKFWVDYDPSQRKHMPK
jgi:hypothetical protein